MTDKVQKIREEVERIQLYTQSEVLKQVLDIIDKVQEEPNQKFKIGDRIKFKGVYNEDVVRTITDIQKYDDGSCRYIFADGSLHSVGNNEIELMEEPVSEELEEAANNAVIALVPSFGQKYSDGSYVSSFRDCFKREELLELFKAGANWKEQQMMADAIDGKVIANGMGNPILHLWDKGRHLIDKKVKVIVIKED